MVKIKLIDGRINKARQIGGYFDNQKTDNVSDEMGKEIDILSIQYKFNPLVKLFVYEN